MPRSAFRPLALAVLLGACSDLLPDAERVPARIELSSERVTVVEGSPVPLAITVFDQKGHPFDRLPGWAVPAWSFDAEGRVENQGGRLVALGPGAARATVDVAGFTASALVRVNPRSLGLSVDGVYLTQSVQTYDRSVPLVAGRDAYLRVFLKGDQPNYFTPKVRVHLYHAGELHHSWTLSPDGDSIPTEIVEGNVTASWNAYVPGRLVRPGISLVVEVDPEGTVPARDGSRLRFPATGTLALNVVTVPKLWLRLVPIHQAAHGTTGSVTPQNRERWIRDLLAMFPIAEYDVDIRDPFSTDASATTAQGWSTLLREIALLRKADGNGRYYYGILTHPGGVNIGGLGYIGGYVNAEPAAIGYDALPAAAGTLAHELGHNFGRLHAPCGGPGGVDTSFPYGGGGIGVHGFDVFQGVPKDPSREKDLMSYCNPEWISDYTYRGVLDFRRDGDGGTSGVAGDAKEPTLLVWGQIDAGGAELEPAFQLTTRPALPAEPGPYRIEGLDAGGAVLFSYSFKPAPVADMEGDVRHFVYAIPARLAQTDRLDRLRLVGPGVRAERRSAGPEPAPPTLRRRSGTEVRMEWDASRRPMALVRDPVTGEVISIVRDGAAALRTRSPELEVLLSDGVRTTRSTHRVR